MKMEIRSREIDKLHKRRDRYDIADWQRDEVWSKEKKQKLIDSILRDWHIPKLYFVEASEAAETWEVVDGQQRLATIFEFLDNRLELSTDTAEEFGGRFYKELDANTSDQFDDYKVDYEEITEAEEGEAQEYFLRLQQGLTLTTAERLNAVPSNLTVFARRLSKHPFLTERVAVRNYRKAFIDICCKVLAIEIDGIDTRLRLPELEELLRSNAGFSPRSAVAKRVRRTFDFLHQNVFLERSVVLRNRSVVQSVVTLTGRLLQGSGASTKGERLGEFFESFMVALVEEVEKGRDATETDLVEFQSTLSANIASGPQTRHNILMRRLLIFDDEFADVLGPTSVAESGMTSEIAPVCEEVKDALYLANKVYEAEHGVDLFKATNETTKALGAIAQPATNVKDFAAFIDALYFLLYEGSGNGKRIGDSKGVVEDVCSMRTELRHDIDHGKAGKIKAKRKGQGKVFAKYANTPSPQVLSPEKFPIVQTRILAAVREFVQDLSAVEA